VEQKWFEMPEIRRRRLEGAVWIPLRASIRTDEGGEFGHAGYKSEFYGVGTLAVAVGIKAEATNKLGWDEVGLCYDHSGFVEKGKYVPSDVRHGDYDGVPGIYLVLAQRGNREEHEEWHLHQDVAITLRLKRENDIWVSMDEGYIEVARLKRRDDGSARLLEIRASHLRDYLCARGMALFVTSYRQRISALEDASHIIWPDGRSEERDATDRWQGHCWPIHEGGMEYGAKTAVFHMSRPDVGSEEDVPTAGLPGEGAVESSSWTREHTGRKLYFVQGQLWRSEWVDPAPSSPIVRRDKMPATVFFVTDAASRRQRTRCSTQVGGCGFAQRL
jgi:hypothetical protein